MATGYINIPGGGSPSWKAPVDTATDLPVNGNSIGDARISKDTSVIYVWDGASWQASGGVAGVSSLNTLTGSLTLAAGSGISITPSGGDTLTIASTGGGSGTVTSVGLTAPSFLSVANSPVTTSGTIALTLANQSANTVFAGPGTGSPAAPTFRALVAADIPSLSGVYANLALSNLAAVAINTSLLPNADATLNLGSPSLQWNTVFIEKVTASVGVATPAFQLTTSPTTGYVLTSDSSGNGTWQPASGGGGGDVSGPGSSTDMALVRWDGSSGTDVDDSVVILSDLGNMTGLTGVQIEDEGILNFGTASSTNTVGFKAPASATDIVYTLPAADGSGGQFLQTDGTGGLSWATASGSGNTFNDTASIDLTDSAGTITADLNLSADPAGMGNQLVALSIESDGLLAQIADADIIAAIPIADTSTTGLLSDTDWNTFNSKQAAGNYITSLTGDVTGSGPGAASTTIANGAVSLAKMANLAANTIIGNNTGSPATPIALSVSQATAMLNAFVGDSGAGGTKGLVPAPGAGDAAADKFLKADGTWATTPGSSYTFADSIVDSMGTVTLDGDSATPGNEMYYGTDGGGAKGFFSLPSPGPSYTFNDTNSIDLDETAGSVTADLNLSSASASMGNFKATASIESDGLLVQAPFAATSQTGFLTSTDWNTFNSKLGTTLNSANIFVGNGSNVATGVAMTGDIGISNTGATAIQSGVITNTMVNATAGIALSKLAALTTGRALQSNASTGFIEVSAVTNTELGYLSGVTSAIQTQLNAKITNVLTTTGDLIYSSSGTTASRLGIGSSNQVLTVVGGVPTWQTPSGGSGTVTSVGLADSTGIFNIANSPVTTTGTLTLSSLKDQDDNYFLAGPSQAADSVTTFNSGSGSFIVPEGFVLTKINIWGGGGGGGASGSALAGSGGGGGGYCEYVLPTPAVAGTSVSYSVGAAGTAGTAGGNGGDGGNTTVSTYSLTANGGTHGNGTGGGHGNGGTASGGTTNTTGSDGTNASGGSLEIGGNGGASPNGGATATGTINAGTPGNAPGGGGSGGGYNVPTNNNGAAGAAGRVVFTCAGVTTFRPIVPADLPTGNLTAAGTDGITITNGTDAVIGSGTSVQQHVADSTHNGYLSSTDWSTFNGKQAAGNYITALTGDVVATGPGSVASTIQSGVIVNSMISASAAIARSKTASGNAYRILANDASGVMSENAAITASRAVASNANGQLVAATTTATELGYVNGVTSAIQTQLNGKLPTTITTTGDIIYSSSGTTAARLGIGSSNQVLTVVGGVPTWQNASSGSFTAPKVTKYTSGSGTWNKTGSPLYIRVQMVGGGGYGSGPSGGGSQSAATASTFGTSLLVANGGNGNSTSASGGTGGTASLGTGPVGTALTGGTGAPGGVANGTYYANGGNGASSPFGGEGTGSIPNTGFPLSGSAGVANTGSGGGGGGSTSTSNAGGGGGGAGGYIDAIITSPSSSYSYAVGSGGTNSNTGGSSGGSGYIIVTEYYQ